MRIVVHDYGGYGFPLQLARALAARGHDVLHLHAAGFRSPRGAMARRTTDPPNFRVDGVELDERSQQNNFVRRVGQERRYGKVLAGRIESFAPDVVISANTPPTAQAIAAGAAHGAGAGFVTWIQDLYSVAIRRIVGRRAAFIGRLAAARFERLERRILLESEGVVAITSAFRPILERWHIPEERISVIENWAPMDELTVTPKANAWSEAHRLSDMPVLMYAGTLGRKHDPSLLVSLAAGLPDAKVVVIAEGAGAQWLARGASRVENLVLLPLQPPDQMSEVLASADVLLALLEPDAGEFSVPSKVLTYFLADRAILASMPSQNLAAELISRTGAGRVVDPAQRQEFVATAQALLDDPAARAAMGSAGRAYAASAFDIGTITDRFEAVLTRCAAQSTRSERSVAPDTGGEQ